MGIYFVNYYVYSRRILMIIDIHAHVAGDYGKVDLIKNTAATYNF